MPVEITENFIHIRQRNPDLFEKDSFVTIFLSVPQGIKAVVGRLVGETKTTIQVYLFDRRQWTPGEAQKWIAEHKRSKA